LTSAITGGIALKRILSAICTALLCSAVSATAIQAPVTGSADTGYKMKVVSRSTEAVDYHHKGKLKVDIKGTDLMPPVNGKAEVEGTPGGVKIEVNLEHLRPAHDLGLAYLTYVLWAITPEGRTHNLGELIVNDGKTQLKTTTALQAFALVVTAEPYFAVTEPSDLVVAQNEVKSNTHAGVEPVDVKYELISRDTYNGQVKPVDEPMYGIDPKLPLDLLQARNAVRIARDANAQQYAPAELQKAEDLLNQANNYYRQKQGSGPIGTVARQAAQTAEAARVITIKREQDEEVASERKAQEDRTAQAQADAEKRQQEAQQAQADAQQAQADRAAAEQARQQALLAQQQAQLQAQQADQARQQAENDKQQMRARLLAQLNQILETRDTARGLIVNMPDVLFDIGKADLKPTARERLAKIAGILLSYPDIKVEIDGYTDSTGSLDFNERLSQSRADSVRSYLGGQGVKSDSMTTQGFGPNNPIASNETASGRQQNRRVEMVVSGESIGQLTNGQ
jgi:outer membrane protein OmpA-like peptidoglycan-associated protein